MGGIDACALDACAQIRIAAHRINPKYSYTNIANLSHWPVVTIRMQYAFISLFRNYFFLVFSRRRKRRNGNPIVGNLFKNNVATTSEERR